MRCRDCCGHPRTCHSAVAFFRVTPCAPHRFGTPTSHPGEAPGSAPWATEGGVRPGPFLPLPRRLWRRVSQEVPGPLPWCPGPVPPVPSPEACPSDRGPRPGRGLWCRAILSENADTWAPHRQWALPTSPPTRPTPAAAASPGEPPFQVTDPQPGTGKGPLGAPQEPKHPPNSSRSHRALRVCCRIREVAPAPWPLSGPCPWPGLVSGCQTR